MSSTGERFRTRLGAWLAVVGVAIGLGNVWRFPYMMGSYGGSAFLLLYLALTVLFAAPLLAAEWSLGRHTRQGPIGSYRIAFGRRAGTALGTLLVVSILIADSYYMVVIGNILYTAAFAVGRGFSGAGASTAYGTGLADGALQYGCALGVLAAGIWTVARGVQRGIEGASRWMVPAFGVVVLALVVYVLGLDGAPARILEFLRPDFSRIGVAELFAALGQAFFSLGVGGTFMVVYGAYLDDRTRLRPTAYATALGDTGAALLAALFIVPAVLVFGLDPATGPGLIFATLPELFGRMPGGRLLGGAFLGALLLMAFLSAVAGLQVVLAGLREIADTRLRPGAALALVAALEAVLMWPSAHDPDLIGTLDLVFGSGMQILGALVAVLALAWGLGRAAAAAELRLAGPAAWSWLLGLRWLIPALLFLILGLYLVETLRR